MRLWVWQHVRCELPEEWEMLQFSRRAEQGRCQFADRYQFRLELGWRQVPSAPDMERTLSDYRSQLAHTLGMKDVSDVELAGWRGLEGEVDGVWSTRFGRYLSATQSLVELVWLWPGRPEHDLLRRVLSGCTAEPAAAGHAHWRAFGMDVQVPAGLALSTCQVLPGAAEMTFADPRQPRRRERFDRLGMLRQWLHAPVPAWLRGQLPRGAGDVAEDRHAHAGHEIYTCTAWEPRVMRDHFLRRRPHWRARAWICPHDGRLYCHRTQHLVHGEAPPAVTDTAPLACCAAWGHAA